MTAGKPVVSRQCNTGITKFQTTLNDTTAYGYRSVRVLSSCTGFLTQIVPLETETPREPREGELYVLWPIRGQHFIDTFCACVLRHCIDIVNEAYFHAFVRVHGLQFAPVFFWFSDLRPTHDSKSPSVTLVRRIKGLGSPCRHTPTCYYCRRLEVMVQVIEMHMLAYPLEPVIYLSQL